MGALQRWFEAHFAARPQPSARPHGCLCCGRCCEGFGGHLQASKADIARWKKLGRDDLLRRVSSIGWLWISPETGLLEERCPFLERTGPDQALCTINDVKPDICRAYPTIAHGSRCLRGVFLGWATVLAWGDEIAAWACDVAGGCGDVVATAAMLVS